MVAVKILGYSEPYKVSTQYGDKNKVNIMVRELSTGKEIKTTMFEPKGGFWFKVGDEVLADIVVNDKYVNIKKVERMGAMPEVPAPAPVQAPVQAKPKENGYSNLSKEEWAAKELRDFRSRALAQVSSKIDIGKDESELEWAERVIMVAELRFVDYIYRGYHIPDKEKV